MAMGWGRRAALVSAVLVSGCAGVPQLYKPATVEPSRTLAPKVDHIVRQIGCELGALSKVHLADRHYIITAILTLQVDDEINLTPSLSFIEPLTVAATNRTMTQGLGIGGSRQRTFAATFYFDSRKLLALAPCDAQPDRLYRLDGNLGLAEIARDGIGVHARQTAMLGEAPPAPTFASQVKFVVTRSVSALGPTWTLISFKGPGGTNGLLNGKALTTDTLNIAFAPKPEKEADPATQRLIATLETLIAWLQRREERAGTGVVEARDALTKLRRDRETKMRFFSQEQLFRSDQAIRSAQGAVEAAVREQDAAADARIRAQGELATARADADKANARSQQDAINLGQSLINTIILQNLAVQPR